MATKIQYADAGMASLVTHEFEEVPLYVGRGSNISTSEILADQNANLPAYTVVGRVSANKKVTKCVLSAMDGSQVPIGVTSAPALDVGGDQAIGILRDGDFNIAALNWDDSFDTELKKVKAFEGAPTPTSIVIKKIGG